MDREKVVRFWLDGAQEDWEFAVGVWKSGKQLHNALFFGQLVLEKILKAYHYHKKEDHPLLIHDLGVLAERTGLTLTDEQKVDMKVITGFNISARYDDYKLRIRRFATKEYTEHWMNKIDLIRVYLLTLF
jgi:HEPN domain-containing protein